MPPLHQSNVLMEGFHVCLSVKVSVLLCRVGTPGTHESGKRTRGDHFSRHDRQAEGRGMLRSACSPPPPPPPQQATQRGLPRTRGWPSSDYTQKLNYQNPSYSQKDQNKDHRGQAKGWEGETRHAVPKKGCVAEKTTYFILSFSTSLKEIGSHSLWPRYPQRRALMAVSNYQLSECSAFRARRLWSVPHKLPRHVNTGPVYAAAPNLTRLYAVSRGAPHRT